MNELDVVDAIFVLKGIVVLLNRLEDKTRKRILRLQCKTERLQIEELINSYELKKKEFEELQEKILITARHKQKRIDELSGG